MGSGHGFSAARMGALMTGLGNEALCVIYDIGLPRDQICLTLVFDAGEDYDGSRRVPPPRTTVLIRGPSRWLLVILRGFFPWVAALVMIGSRLAGRVRRHDCLDEGHNGALGSTSLLPESPPAVAALPALPAMPIISLSWMPRAKFRNLRFSGKHSANARLASLHHA